MNGKKRQRVYIYESKIYIKISVANVLKIISSRTAMFVTDANHVTATRTGRVRCHVTYAPENASADPDSAGPSATLLMKTSCSGMSSKRTKLS